jgi:hypothetical protein
VTRREDTFGELYREDEALAEEALERAATSASRDGSSTVALSELEPRAPERDGKAPSLYGEGDLRAAIRKESYGFEVSGAEREESADPSGAISLPSDGSDEESFRLCGLADTLSRK